ncbi:hypothetical protein OIU84_001809 [Salix udensis]|uniref:NAC domain-containing protein n=1 Tax=Salix udensis TaxID=889485 RepID=A0AAD6K7P5_9ROSI|nr:hypothetical protein OIU84_001809 [Salix udensis]
MEENLPPGFRFHPTDEELITCYLTRKVSDTSFTSKAMVDVDLNRCEPWDLPGKASMGEKEWERQGNLSCRSAGRDEENPSVLQGVEPQGARKSNWVMHEYRLENNHPFKSTKEEWVVCRVFQKSAEVKKPQQEPSSQQSLGSPCDTNSIANDQFGDIELLNLNNIANSSSGFTNVLAQSYSNESNVNMDMQMNWAAAREAATLPSFPWPSGLLSTNLTMNSLLLKALQLRSYQQREATATNYSFLTNGIAHDQFGADLGSNFQASSSRVLDSVPQPQQEQPFNLDSVNW